MIWRRRKTRFYVATDFARKPEAQDVANTLEVMGLESAGRWYRTQPAYKDDGLGGELVDDEAEAARRVSAEDLEDINGSGVFIQLTSGEKARGGRHVELGYAIALAERDRHRQVLCVGPREHAFHYHPLVQHLTSLEALWDWADRTREGAVL